MLDIFDDGHPEWGVRELALALDLSRSNAHALLSSLESINVLQRTPEGRYRLGWRLLELAGGVSEATLLRRVAPRRMRALADVTGQSTHLAVWDGRETFFFARAVARQGVSVSQATPGTTLPAHATASGKVLLGRLSSSEAMESTLPGRLSRLSARTQVDKARLWSEVDQARTRGLATSFEETVAGVDAVAVPIRGLDGRVLAALGVSMPPGRLDGYLSMFRRHLLATAASITAGVRAASLEETRARAVGFALEV